jgi:hypothetical protein
MKYFGGMIDEDTAEALWDFNRHGQPRVAGSQATPLEGFD